MKDCVGIVLEIVLIIGRINNPITISAVPVDGQDHIDHLSYLSKLEECLCNIDNLVQIRNIGRESEVKSIVM